MAVLTVPDGTRLHYRVQGDGRPPMVLVHGWCSNLTHWDAVARPLARRHQVLAIDRRGHGRSSVPDQGYTATGHADDLALVLRHERIRGAVVAGHAGGVPAVLELARREPELVGALVLVDGRVGPGSDLDGPGRGPLGELVESLRGPHGGAVFETMYRGFFSERAGEPGRRALGDALTVPLAVAAADLASLAIDTEATAREVRQPVLWLAAGPTDDERLAGVFADLVIGRVVGSGHFPHVEVPDQVVAMITRFAAGLEPQ